MCGAVLCECGMVIANKYEQYLSLSTCCTQPGNLLASAIWQRTRIASGIGVIASGGSKRPHFY